MVPDGVLHAVPIVSTRCCAGAVAAMERMTVVLIK